MVPLAVEVQAGHVGAGHAVDDSVWVDHGNDKELVVFEQPVANGFILGQFPDDGFCDEGPCSFAGMLPRQYQNGLLGLVRSVFFVEVD